MSNKQAVFRFELNESLYFQSGQEVADIIGASLDPEIAIQAFDDYISIRGVIELSGDYHKMEMPNTMDEPPFDMNDIHEKNFMEKVTEKKESVVAFTHRFPVEISVPSYRVKDTEEVTVQITSFDYEIPNHYQMNLKASIEIGGINEETDQANDDSMYSASDETINMDAEDEKEGDLPSDVETEQEDVHEEATPEEKHEETEEEEPAAEEIQESSEKLDNTASNQEHLEETSSSKEEDINESEMEDDEVKTEQKKKKKSQTLADFFNKGEQKSTDVNEETEDVWYEDESSANELTDNEETIKTNETSRENEQNKMPILSLSKVFKRDHEDEYTKMRLCIVQDRDTIASIAERYEITSKQLTLMNHLTDESIMEGQILYIPEKVQK